MKPKEEKFFYGVTQQQISPYTTYYKRRGKGVWKLHKAEKDNRAGVTIECVSIGDNTNLNCDASASIPKPCSQEKIQ